MPLTATTIIARNALFRGLPIATIERIASLASTRKYKPDTVVFLSGDAGDALYGVVTGRVRISTSGESGREVHLNTMEPGDAFGEIALLDGQRRTASARTTVSTELVVIHRADFLALLHKEPKLAVHLIELLCKRVRWTSQQMEDSSLLNAPARLAKRLLSIAKTDARDAAPPLRVTISQEELAQFLGLSRQIVNKHLQSWKAEGWIATGRGSVTVQDVEALRGVARG